MKQFLLIVLTVLLLGLGHILYQIATWEHNELEQSEQLVIELAIPPENGDECVKTIVPSVGPGPVFIMGECS